MGLVRGVPDTAAVVQMGQDDSFFCCPQSKLPKDRYVYTLLKPWLGDGLLVSEGKKWIRNRRLLTPAFHYEILRGYVPVINDCLETFFKKWTVSAKEGLPVYAFQDVTLDM